jgi:hypothetical protein
MKRKVSTIMDEALFRRAKLEAARQGRPLSALLDEALGAYLSAATGRRPPGGSLVEASWGVFTMPPDVVRLIMEDDDEDGWLES